MAHALFIFENFYPFSHFDFLLTPHVWRTSSGMGTTVWETMIYTFYHGSIKMLWKWSFKGSGNMGTQPVSRITTDLLWRFKIGCGKLSVYIWSITFLEKLMSSEIPHVFLWNRKVNYRVQNNLKLVPILGLMSPPPILFLYDLDPYLFSRQIFHS